MWKRKIVGIVLLAFSCYLSVGAQTGVSFLRITSEAGRFIPRMPVISPGISTLPFEDTDKMLLTDATVDGIKKTFIIDTGAPGLVLHTSTPPQTLQLAHSLNGTVHVGNEIVKNISWTTSHWEQLHAVSLNINHLERYLKSSLGGLIGMEMLQGKTLIFDPQHKQIILLNSNKHKLTNLRTPSESLPIQYMEHLPVIQVTLNGKPFWFGIDTGAGTSLIDAAVARSLDSASFEADGAELIEALNQESLVMERKIFKNIHLGSFNISNQTLALADLTYLNQSKSNMHLSGLLGLDILRKLSCGLDFYTHRFNLWE